jgi:pimeloyl-ACP methyl ester carboxylesterase
MPFSYRDEIKELTELTRKEASGSFIQLTDGFTHYELSDPLPAQKWASPKSVDGNLERSWTSKSGGFGGGAEGGGGVVLAHGFSVPYFIYDPTFVFLAQSGFRVLRYDLFGRGYSDRPVTRYNIDFFVKQLGDLLDALGLTAPVSLVGLSTGGAITAVFTARFPERVDKLVLIDPVGAKPLPFAPLLRVATMPLVGEAIAGLIRSDRLPASMAAMFFDRKFVDHFQPRYIPQMQYKGFRRGILSTIRNHMLDSILDVYKQIGEMQKPVLLLWGRDDMTVPFQHSNILRTAMPQMEFHAFEDCGHTPHYEKPEEVNPILLRFLRG